MHPLNTFTLYLAPPAWGKTHLFKGWVQLAERPYLYISPLRALADEVQVSLGRLAGVKIVTPENTLGWDWEALAYAAPDTVVVWDEVHLVQAWGEDFRWPLLEAWHGFCASGLTGVGLTATASASFLAFLRESLAGHHSHLLVGDAGNYTFKNPPRRWLWGPRNWLEELLRSDPAGTLLFCEHRQAVEAWVDELNRSGVRTWGCKGGETVAFSQRLNRETSPQVIVATSCLSHGVNLPSLNRVVLLCPQVERDMLHQMATRGGRRGESYEVWCEWGKSPVPCARLPALLRLFVRVLLARLHALVGEWGDDA